MNISEKELRKIISEAIQEVETEFGGPELTPEKIENRVRRRITPLRIKQSKERLDYDDFWRNQTMKDFPQAADLKSSDWLKVYEYFVRKEIMGQNVNKVPEKVLGMKNKNAVRKPSNTKVGQLMDMLYANFISNERKGGATSSRDEIYKALKNFHFKTSSNTAYKNVAGGSWLTQANRSNELNRWKIKFAEICDEINKRYSDVRSYIAYNADKTNQYDLRDVINTTYNKLQGLNEIINDDKTIDELIYIARLLMKSSEPSQRKFYMGDESGKNIGIISILEDMKKYGYEINITLNELDSFVESGYDYDIDSRGKIIRNLTESVMKTIKDKLNKRK